MLNKIDSNILQAVNVIIFRSRASWILRFPEKLFELTNAKDFRRPQQLFNVYEFPTDLPTPNAQTYLWTNLDRPLATAVQHKAPLSDSTTMKTNGWIV